MTPDSRSPFHDPAEPRREFRDGLRRAFVEGRFSEEEHPTVERRLARMLEPTPAGAPFVADLRARFVAPADLAAQPEFALAKGRRVASAAPGRSASSWRPLLALAALALLALTTLWWADREPAFIVFNQSVAVASVDGRPLGGPSLRPGEAPCEVCTPSTNLRLGYEDLFRLELAKDSAVHLSSPTIGADGRVRAPISIESGEIVCVTLGDPRLEAVVIETATAFVRVSGASVSVLPHGGGEVCVCVRSGSVTITSKLGGHMEVVAGAGQRAVVRADGVVELASPDVGEERLRNLAMACDDLASERFETADYSRAWNVLEAY